MRLRMTNVSRIVMTYDNCVSYCDDVWLCDSMCILAWYFRSVVIDHAWFIDSKGKFK